MGLPRITDVELIELLNDKLHELRAERHRPREQQRLIRAVLRMLEEE